MRAFYKDFYGCHADLCQAPGHETTRLRIRDPYGHVFHEKEYRTWRGAKIAMGMLGDCWTNELTGKRIGKR